MRREAGVVLSDYAFQWRERKTPSPHTVKAREPVYTRVCIRVCAEQNGHEGGMGPERLGRFTKVSFGENNGNFTRERYASRSPNGIDHPTAVLLGIKYHQSLEQ